ncbi:Ubiquitin carrier protein [Taphrina deformans PYCC 5710]|uniref:Ubiquitin carrier protein n=1 Tax=Taphrina deformans (strain PYCC 5710 / ATCC 11124 / CBS 356.35 / IMI 108563 / JCM 9778 / NBRC 8474) TaxID=1097556 RepID=R4XCN5_TAPDE|nr:Ubiquitin carrier protein [Taphrina deformans PYCC 5710]|eukprot:CCG82141.1 Ubiquitin carrier protein [Taphrina deformans PYCC 5710]
MSQSRLAIEYASLRATAPAGLYISLSPVRNGRAVQWDGTMFIRDDGPYRGGILEFVMTFEEYPEKPPVVSFKSAIHHPLVTGTGTFDLSRGFPQWTSDSTAAQVLNYLKTSFSAPSLSSVPSHCGCADNQCLEMLHEYPDLFTARAQECASTSTQSEALHGVGVEGVEGHESSENAELTYEEMMSGISRYCKAQGLI